MVLTQQAGLDLASQLIEVDMFVNLLIAYLLDFAPIVRYIVFILVLLCLVALLHHLSVLWKVLVCHRLVDVCRQGRKLDARALFYLYPRWLGFGSLRWCFLDALFNSGALCC